MSDQPIAQAAKKGGGSAAIFGILMIILGLVAMFSPMMVGAGVAMLIAFLLVAAGIMRIIWAFKAESFGSGVFKFAVGVLTLGFGLYLLARPGLAISTLTIFLAIYFLVDGIFEVIGAFDAKPAEGWGWLLFGGIVSLLLGLMIWRGWPLSGAWAVGILIGIRLLFSGIAMLMVGTTVRSAAKEVLSDS